MESSALPVPIDAIFDVNSSMAPFPDGKSRVKSKPERRSGDMDVQSSSIGSRVSPARRYASMLHSPYYKHT